MKKRILSLLLALAMAATLAPATALVDSSVSKAASVSLTTSSAVSSSAVTLESNAEGFGTTSGSSIVTNVIEGFEDITIKNDSASEVSVSWQLSGRLADKIYVSVIPASRANISTVKVDANSRKTLRVYGSGVTPGDGDATLEVWLGEADDYDEDTASVILLTAGSKDDYAGEDIPVRIDGYPITVDGMYVGGSTSYGTVLNIIKSEGNFSFKINDNGGATTKIGFSNGKGSARPDGGSLSFNISKVDANGDYTITPKSIEKLKAGVYRQNLMINGEDSGSIFTFVVSNEYKATFNLDNGKDNGTGFSDNGKGGLEAWSVDLKNTAGDTSITLPTESQVVRPGYALKGWKSGKTYEPGESVKMIGDMTFTAVWTIEEYQLTLNGDTEDFDGETLGSETMNVKLGTVLPKNTFKRVGYTFTGWTDVASGGYAKYADGATITDELLDKIRNEADPALYAVWEPIKYTVSFEANVPSGATISTKYSLDKDDVVVTYGKVGIKPADQLNTFAVNKYVFTGWALDREGLKSITDFSDVNVNPEGETEVTLYATWAEGNSAVVYTEEFDAASNKIFAIVGESEYSDLQPKVGYTQDDFTYGDGTVITGALTYDDDGFVEVYPSYTKADEWVVNYLVGGQTSTEINKVDINSGSISFPKVTLGEKEKLMGWYVWETYPVDDTLISGHFNAKDVITAITEYCEKYDVANNHEINFVGKVLPTADNADFNGKTYTKSFHYGTTKAYIESVISKAVKLTRTVNGVAMSDIDPSDTMGVDSATIVTSPTYAPTNKDGELKNYGITGIRVKANKETSNAGSTFSITPATQGASLDTITVTAKITDNVVKTISSLNAINLPAGATAWDAVDAVTAPVVGQTVKVTTDENKSYNVNVNALGGVTGNTLGVNVKLTDADGNVLNTVTDVKDKIDSATFEGYINAEYIFDANNTTENSYGQLTIGTKTIYFPNGLKNVKVKINFTDKGYTPDAPEDEEVISTEIAMAHSFIERGIAVRLYRTGEHMYVMTGEVDTMIKNGWKLENDDAGKNSFKASTTKTAVYDTPVYRVYNKNNGGMHFYTKNKAEADGLVKAGWAADYKGEPVFYVSNNATGNKVYRAYNPNSKNGEHHWTKDKAEHDSLISKGWKDESTDANVWYSPAN